MISVVIPLYNKAKTIERAIRSVLEQKHLPDEIVIVDDGSTDEGASIARNISSDIPIRVISQENRGVAAARNRGIQESQHEWIALLDADDTWDSMFISTMIHLHDRYPFCGVLASAYGHTDQRGVSQTIKLNNMPFEDDCGELTNYFEVASSSNPPFCSISVMIRKDCLLQIGGFPLGVKSGEDLLTWARLAINNRIAYSKLPLATFFPERESYYSKPSRIPAEIDVVGNTLEEMLSEHPDIKGLKAYVAHWHKMRSSIFLRLPNHEKECREEIRMALEYDSTLRKKLNIYFILTLLPYPLRMAIFKSL